MKNIIALHVALLCITPVGGFADSPMITPGHAGGCYSAGEPVTWTVIGGQSDTTLPYTIQSGSLTKIAQGTLRFTNGQAQVTAQFASPDTLLMSIRVNDKKKVLGGAAIAWPQIKPAAPEPADFDTFWKEKVHELSVIPANPVLEEVDSGSPQVQLWKISMDNIRGSKIRGYLARPKGTAPAPAMLQLQHAGTHGLKKDWVVGPAKDGWMALNIIAHDLPVDREDSFYVEQLKGPLNNYIGQGADDREKSYFLRMYLSCYRAADYLTKRGDWNKATLLVQGTSMGGMQGLATAGLHPAVTTATFDVPAGCNLLARGAGFPWWKGSAAKTKAAGYYDPVNFAKRIRCPVLVGVGLCDTIAPPSGIFAMINEITTLKRVVIMPTAEHTGNHSAYEIVKKSWWKAASAGKPLPMEEKSIQ